MKKSSIYILLAFTLMLIIFLSSNQAYADQSIIQWIDRYLSFDFIYQWVNNWAFNYGGQVISVGQIGYAAFIEFFIRKSVHFLIYALLAYLWYKALQDQLKSSGLTMLVAFLITAGYASFDEFYQFFQADRSGLLDDVVLDSFGALAGIILARLHQSKLWK